MEMKKFRYLKYGDILIARCGEFKFAVIKSDKVIGFVNIPTQLEDWQIGSLYEYIRDEIAKLHGVFEGEF
jgi:hypothetical protein